MHGCLHASLTFLPSLSNICRPLTPSPAGGCVCQPEGRRGPCLCDAAGTRHPRWRPPGCAALLWGCFRKGRCMAAHSAGYCCGSWARTCASVGCWAQAGLPSSGARVPSCCHAYSMLRKQAPQWPCLSAPGLLLPTLSSRRGEGAHLQALLDRAHPDRHHCRGGSHFMFQAMIQAMRPCDHSWLLLLLLLLLLAAAAGCCCCCCCCCCCWLLLLAAAAAAAAAGCCCWLLLAAAAAAAAAAGCCCWLLLLLLLLLAAAAAGCCA